MQVQFEVTLGQNKFIITDQVESQIEFFEKLAFFSELPKVGPNGEDDLVLRVRHTKEGYKYLTVYSPSAKMELDIGQSKQRPGECFVKDWKPEYNAEGGEATPNQLIGQSSSNIQPAPSTPQIQRPAAQQAAPPVQQQTAPVVNPAVPAQAAPQAAAPVQPQQTQPNNNAQIQQQATDALAEFGV